MTFDECYNAILNNIEQTNRSMLTAIKNVEKINKTLDGSNEKVKDIKNSLYNTNANLKGIRKKNIKSREIIFRETYL
jgi:septal ring factor EnvC (AmiA/AmiB activator)